MSRTLAPAALACLALAACGTATPTSTQADGVTPARRAVAAPGATAPASCQTAAAAEITAVTRRVYDQAVHGRNVASSVRRLARSTALGAAVAARDPRAVRAALAPLIKHQIVEIRINAGSRVLARHGSKASYAPVRGAIRDRGRVVGGYVLTVTDDRALIALTRSLTGATARFGARGAVTLPATRYPSGATTIALRIPPLPASVCGATAAQTRVGTIGFVARNVARGEASGGGAVAALRHAQKDPAFRHAIVARDPVSLRRAIVGFFRDKRFHIVRARATDAAGRPIGDVGGPFVLSPAAGTIHAGGRPAGRFQIAVQDDTGFIKLVHRLTGADVVLHKGRVPVPGSNISPGPAHIAGTGMLRYHGRPFHYYGFTATSFPAGPLYVQLLVH